MSIKIGQVAKLLDMPVETIRFYEKNQLLFPKRTEGSSYREYDAWDLFNLTECMQQRARGFSVKEIRKLMREADLEEVYGLLSAQIGNLEAELSLIQRKIQELKSWKTKLETVRQNIGRYWFEKSPEYAYIICVKNTGREYGDYDFQNPDLAKWYQQLPFIKYGVLIRPEDIASSRDYFEWILMISKEDPSFAEIPVKDEKLTIPGGICLHTILDIGAKGGMNMEMFQDLVRYLQENNLSLSGTITGELLLRNYEKENWHRYIELSIPVK